MRLASSTKQVPGTKEKKREKKNPKLFHQILEELNCRTGSILCTVRALALLPKPHMATENLRTW